MSRARQAAARRIPVRIALLAAALGLWSAPQVLEAQDTSGAVRLEARPERVQIVRGASTPLRIVAIDGAGRIVEAAAIRVVAPRGALAYADGRVEGIEAGQHRVIATLARSGAEPLTLEVPVTVDWPRVDRVAVTSAEPGRLYPGTALRLQARALHADGSERPGAAVEWTSSAPDRVSVDLWGVVTAHEPGPVALTATVDGVDGRLEMTVPPFPAVALRLEGGLDSGETARTGDVVRWHAVATTADGATVDDVPVTWSQTQLAADTAFTGSSAPAQVRDGAFVADAPGVYAVVATAGPLSARATVGVQPRDVVRELEVVGHGLTQDYRTTDLWVFEGQDGRDYALTGSKVADGHAYLFDVTDPAQPVKVDSIQVNGRTVNDVKVSPDGRYAAISREGAADRRNGVVVLDLSALPSISVASIYDEGLTGGVHNMFATDDYLFALSNGDKYVILDMSDISAPRYVSEYNHPDSRVHDVWVYDGIAYSAEWGTGVVVVDVGNGRWGGSIDAPVFVTSFPLPTGATHAVFPYWSESAQKMYLFVGDEIMNRRGLPWAGYPRSMGSYADQYDDETGLGGIPLTTQGYIQVVDFTDPESPEMVARYEVSEFGTHNFWVEDDVLYAAYYEGGVRAVDVSGELMGNLYTQGREMAVFKSAHPEGYTANATMVWGAQPFKGHIFFSDTNSGLWSARLVPRTRPIS
ncbi:MAG: Ig-like domain-containing protein [Gemmatimonadetes bacterium]|nr:Ig-like domain-containing protein [Gemmatimonadota bacterium]